MSSPTLALARLLKEQHPDAPASIRLVWARQQLEAKTRPAIEWDRDRAEWKEKGFTVVVTVRPDDDIPDLSYLGEYSNRDSLVAIKRPNPGRGEYKYFIPATSEREHYDALRRENYGRALARELAREYVQRDFRRMEAYNNGHWYMLGIDVRVFRAGIELGSAAVWGIESDSDREYIDETTRDLAREAIAEARASLKKLCRAEAR